MKTKICTLCKEEKILSSFSKSKAHKDGLYPRCKDCMKKYKDEHKEELKKKNAEYYKNNIDKIKEYNEINKEYRSEERKKYKAKNKDKIYEQHLEYYAKNKDKIINYNRQWYKENIEKAKKTRENYRKEHSEKIKNIRKEYNSTIKAKSIYIANSNRRRAIKNGLRNDFTKEQWTQCKEYFNNCCAYCGRRMDKLHQDHFVPVTKKGAYTISNIIPACLHCNSSKSNRNFTEWYPKQPFYSQDREQKILKYLKIT